MNRRRVGILIFPEVEVLDFCGPFEVFSIIRLDEERRREDSSPFVVRSLLNVLHFPAGANENERYVAMSGGPAATRNSGDPERTMIVEPNVNPASCDV